MQVVYSSNILLSKEDWGGNTSLLDVVYLFDKVITGVSSHPVNNICSVRTAHVRETWTPICIKVYLVVTCCSGSSLTFHERPKAGRAHLPPAPCTYMERLNAGNFSYVCRHSPDSNTEVCSHSFHRQAGCSGVSQ